MIQEHAKEVVKKLGDFMASNGCLKSFGKWHHIVCNEICDESDDFIEETVAYLVVQLLSIMEGYEQKDIENGDETGLSIIYLENLIALLESKNNLHTRNVIKTVSLFSTR
jgi:hypothetical protein